MQNEQGKLGLALAGETKHYPHSPHIPLQEVAVPPESIPLAKRMKEPKTESSIEDLATLLLLTAGFKDGQEHRIQKWSATAGNLGSVELYVVARRVLGLDPGTYFYGPGLHSLASVGRRAGAIGAEEFVRRVIRARDKDCLPDAVIILTAAFHRLARKYGEFGYHLSLLDAGVAASQRDFAAGSLGFWTQTACYTPDDLIGEQLNLRPVAEQVTAAVSIYSSFPERHLIELCKTKSKKDLSSFRGRPVAEVFDELYAESRTAERDLQRTVNVGMARFKDIFEFNQYKALWSRTGQDGASTTFETLSRRKTVRLFDQASISLEQVKAILNSSGADCWPGGS
jgi:SagB-type dehydrogenase family enzyme